jgi:hypothetical protein
MSSAQAPVSVSTPVPTDMADQKPVQIAAGGGSSASAPAAKKDYHGFVAGVFSGIAKLSGMSLLVLCLVFERSLTLCLRSVGHPYVAPFRCHTLLERV